MPSTSNRYNCPIDATMQVIEGRWKGTILCMLAIEGPLRFSELQRKIGDVTSRVLTKQLKELEADGMITRHANSEGKLQVHYAITSRGCSVLPILKAMAEWGVNHRFVQVIVPEDDVAPEISA